MKTGKLFTLLMLSFTSLVSLQCSKTIEVGSDNNNVTLNTFNNKPVGESAKELLAADKPSLVFEVDYMPGFQLQASTIPNLTSFLSTYTRKGAYKLIQKQIAASGKDSLSLKDIDEIERKNRTAFNTANQVAVYILVTDGRYNPPNTLGVSYRNTSIALFGKAIKSFSGGYNQVPTSILETGTLEHELGHLLGLVNLGTPMKTNHADPNNGHHCNNSKCLMYYQAETSQFLGQYLGSSIPTLDANCHNDLIANGGK
jgi:hypothetical protein